MAGSRSKSYTVTKSGRADMLQRKREERAMKRAHATQRRGNTYLADDEHLTSWKVQLNKLGLELRDIPGDGNCLFRALADQLDGHSEHHLRYRSQVCGYMTDHHEDFAPFIDEDIKFDKYVSELRKPGTFAGNDALVAFARLHNVTIVIHQLDSAYFSIEGTDSSSKQRELHLTYHNGEHYSSVRRIGDKSSSPAHIKFKSQQSNPSSHTEQAVIDQLMQTTHCENRMFVVQCLAECDGDVESATEYIKSYNLTSTTEHTDTSSYSSLGSCPYHSDSKSQSRETLTSNSSTTSTTDSGIVCTCDSQSGDSLPQPGAHEQPTKDPPPPAAITKDASTTNNKLLSRRTTKSERKKEKKKRAEARHKAEKATSDFNQNEADHEIYEVVSQVALLSV